jgi:hypothetical protein
VTSCRSDVWAYRRCDDPEPAANAELRHARFGEGRHIGQGGSAVVADIAIVFNLPALMCEMTEIGTWNEGPRDGHEVGLQDSRTFVGNVVHLRSQHQIEERCRQVRIGSDAGSCIIELSGPRLHIGDELLQLFAAVDGGTTRTNRDVLIVATPVKSLMTS